MNPIIKTEQDCARKKFRGIGEGSVRFMATRQECYELLDEIVTHTAHAVVEEVKKMLQT